jgi:hypothetical protein
MNDQHARRQLAEADNSQQVWTALQDALRTQNLVRVRAD